jgi:hypothetical protein
MITTSLVPRQIKQNQKLRIVRYMGNEKVIVFCKYNKLHATVDGITGGAVEQALSHILQEPCKGISARFNGVNIQVDLL